MNEFDYFLYKFDVNDFNVVKGSINFFSEI